MKNSSTGFTLIELLVAITILAIVAVLGWRGLDGIARARVALTSDLEQTRGMQLAFAQLQSDGEHIANTANIAGRPVLAADDGRLTLVRTTLAENQPTRLQVVAYRIRDGVLERRESTAVRDLAELDAIWSATLGDTDNTQVVALQTNVASMTMRYWAGNGPWATATASAQSGKGAANLNQATGLELELTQTGRDGGMSKVFLLGAV
jgi:general secretion pathway protein J